MIFNTPRTPYGTLTYITRTLTQGASPPDPRYGILTYLTLTQGASPPDPPTVS